jgi:hypothetical protein
LLSRIPRVMAIAAAAAVALLVGGWADHSSSHSGDSTAVATLGSGFYDRMNPPPPEGTVTPKSGSWDGIHPPTNYKVVLLSAGSDRPTKTLVAAVKAWAETEHVDLQTLTASGDQLVPRIVTAISLNADLIISAGNDLVDALGLVAASHLSQQFLVVGAELAEPTGNVTAANWPGASFRGEGLGASSTYDAATFTVARCASAIRAGVASVLNDLTGIVVQIP